MPSRTRLVRVERRPEEVRTPGPRWEGVRRILVVRNDRLGDLVATLPAVAALRDTYRGAWIGLLVRPYMAPLARLATDADEVVEDAPDPSVTMTRIGAFAPDAVVVPAPGARVPWLAWRLGVAHRLGTGRRWYSGLFDLRVDEHRRSGARHEVEYALGYAHRAGAPGGPARFGLAVPADAKESLSGWLEAQRVAAPWVAIHAGAGGSGPTWPVGHFVRLATLLRGEGCTVVFTLGPADGAVDEALDAAPAEVRRLPRLRESLPMLAATLQGAALVVANSTGPMHLAAALGAPVLSFHAPWPSNGVRRWGPYSEKGWALVADLDEARTWTKRERIRRAEALMSSISPAAALGCSLGILGIGDIPLFPAEDSDDEPR